MGNSYTNEDLESWSNSVIKLLDGEDVEYTCELKIDGLAVSILYENGEMKRGVTRGDGSVGDVVTPNIKTIENLPFHLPEPLTMEVRGEIYFSKNNFEKLNHRRKKQEEALFKNPRNAAAGTLRMLDSTEVRRRHLDIFIYSLVEGPVEKRHILNLEKLHSLGLPVNRNTRKCHTLREIIEYCQEWEYKKDDLSYEVDGIVIKIDNLIQQEKLGFRSKSPC